MKQDSLEPRLTWAPLRPIDVEAVDVIADIVHTSLPERTEVFLEKVTLSPETCFKLMLSEEIVGYGISHPWYLNNIPPLDEFLREIPSRAECIYVHDVVVLPKARGKGAAADYIRIVSQVAKSRGIPTLALVSVYGTDVMWSRMGFRVRDNLFVRDKLATYGVSAKYMTCKLDD